MDDKRLLQALGQRIRERRTELGWSQEQFAGIAQIDRSYMGGVERGERNVTFTMLCKICLALRCDAGTLTHQLPKVK